ncbi:MAG: hypothetical protein JWO06_1463 [Bacteroidota bacterium]|nr:hypothetical protein [Bacteroidota bacterium]
MKTLRLLFLLMIALVFKGQAQDTLFVVPFALDTFVASPPHLGDTINLRLDIYNFGTHIFSGPLSLNYSINGQLFTSPDTNSGIGYATDTVTIFPSGSTFRILHFSFTGPNFTVGPTVVVIWPRAPGAFALDSASVTFNLTTPSGIAGIDMKQVKAFIADDQLFISSGEQLKNLKMYNAQGALIKEQEISSSATIPMQPFATGIYLVEVTLADNSIKIFKVLNPGR